MEEHAKSSTIRDLTQGPLVRQLLLFALPIMGANLLQSLYTLVDLWAVGNFASEAAISCRGQFRADRISHPRGGHRPGQRRPGAHLPAGGSQGLPPAEHHHWHTAVLLRAVLHGHRRHRRSGHQLVDGPVAYSAGGPGLGCVLSAHRCLGAPFMAASGTLCAIPPGGGRLQAPPCSSCWPSALSNMILDMWFVAGLGWGRRGRPGATIIARRWAPSTLCTASTACREDLGFDFRRPPSAFMAPP